MDEHIEAAPWAKDALFTLTTHGDGEGTSLHLGWSAICQAVHDVHYHCPDADQKAEVNARFLDWEVWDLAPDGFPWQWHAHYEDGDVVVQRITEPALSIPLLVDRFLMWPLPKSVRSDLCVTMDYEYPRSGTNLLSADETRQMIAYLLDSVK